ncbi:MAG: hypothetical protein HYX59_06310 [Elusimicrobia bacterium]|nr:hypothetical protein [Elusimicrobiota bacterium]
MRFLAALDPDNARAFLKTISAFKDGGVEFMFLSGNQPALSLLSGICDRGPLDRLDWTIAWILRQAGALDEAAPCFTVAIRPEPENVARFKSAWAGLGFNGDPPPAPPTLTWTFILGAPHNGISLEKSWDERRLLAEIDGYALYHAPDMMGLSRS